MSHINLLDNTGITGGLAGNLTAGTVRNGYVYESHSSIHDFYGTKGEYATIENCHLVLGSGSVTGIHNWTAAQLTDMESALNNHIPSGGKNWEGAVNNTTPPHLETYTVTP